MRYMMLPSQSTSTDHPTRPSLFLVAVLLLVMVPVHVFAKELDGQVQETDFSGSGRGLANPGSINQLPSWFGVADPSAQQQSGLKNQSPVPESETALPGQISQQHAPLVGHAIKDKEVHGNRYFVNNKGLVYRRITRHPDTAMLKPGDTILAIDGHKIQSLDVGKYDV